MANGKHYDYIHFLYVLYEGDDILKSKIVLVADTDQPIKKSPESQESPDGKFILVESSTNEHA